MQQILRIISQTWERDSYGLFDYEGVHNTSIHLHLDSSCFVAREGNLIHSSLDKVSLSSEYLFDVKQTGINNGYLLSNICLTNQKPTIDSINGLSNKIWYVIPKEKDNKHSHHQPNTNTITNSNEEYYLTKHDIFKLGRVKFKIADCSFEPNPKHFIPGYYNLSYINSTSSPVFKDIYTINEITSKSNECLCKICYSNETHSDNPLINLCLCKGGIGQAHLNCIKTWMSTKLSIKENDSKNIKSYSIKSFNCEICKTPYPTKLQLKGNSKIYNLIDIDIPENSDYVVLESLNQIKDYSNIKTIHVITLNTSKFVIGRGHDSDIRVNDISVSRAHTLLCYNSKERTLMLQDLKSKFGTLVLIKHPLRMLSKPLTLQVGRTLIESQVMDVSDKIVNNHQLNSCVDNIKNSSNQYEILRKDEGEYKEKTISDNENAQNKNKDNNSSETISNNRY